MNPVKRILLKTIAPEYFDLKENAEFLAKLSSKFSRYIDNQIIENYLGEDLTTDGIIRDVCVLFTDIRGFTSFSERNNLQLTNSLLNNYYDMVIDHTRENNGIVDKFLGDGSMSVFGVFEEKDEESYVRKCIATAKSIREDFQLMTSQKDEPELFLGFGVAKGKALVGAFGNGNLVEFTVVGHTVNLASRIEGQADNNRIFTTNEVVKFLDKEEYKIQGRYSLKNISKSVELFEII